MRLPEISAGNVCVLHAERLRVPLSWWLLAGVFSVSICWAFLLVTPPWFAAATGFVSLALVGAGLWSFGSAPVAVLTTAGGAMLVAGTARLPLQYAGAPQPLGPAAARHRMGAGADARAFLLTRPYLRCGVLVPVVDPGDPTPYWLVGSRSPEQLAAALRTARAHLTD